MGRFQKILIGSGVLFIIMAGGFLLWLSPRYTVPVMMYHNVDDTDELKLNTVSPQRFEWHMAYLKKHGFRVLSLEEFVRVTERREPLPRKSVVITFDDGYTDNYDHAYKILKKYGYPATIFVPSDLVNNEGYLNWVQMRKMINNGITIGSHTRRHAYLPDLSIEEQWDEIAASKKILETNLGVAVDYFSYPIGGFNDAIKQLVKKAGYKGATATNRGYDRLNKDVFELNRIRFSDKDHRIDYLWMKLSGYYNLFREAKAPY